MAALRAVPVIVHLLLLTVAFVITLGPFLLAIEMRAREQERARRRQRLLRHAADYHDPWEQYR